MNVLHLDICNNTKVSYKINIYNNIVIQTLMEYNYNESILHKTLQYQLFRNNNC